MTAAKPVPLVSVEDYLAGEEGSEVKHEYLGGFVYAMAGAKNRHNRIATNFVVSLGSKLRGQPCEAFNSDTKLRIRSSGLTRFYYPDGMVVCDANDPDDSFQDNPVVIAEVMSDATRRTDEGEKREAYLTIPTLAVYLLVEQDRPRVVAYRRTERGASPFEAELYEGLDAVVPLDEVSASLPLAELFERVDFSATP